MRNQPISRPAPTTCQRCGDKPIEFRLRSGLIRVCRDCKPKIDLNPEGRYGHKP